LVEICTDAVEIVAVSASVSVSAGAIAVAAWFSV
jgi:hypothetical protein